MQLSTKVKSEAGSTKRTNRWLKLKTVTYLATKVHQLITIVKLQYLHNIRGEGTTIKYGIIIKRLEIIPKL